MHEWISTKQAADRAQVSVKAIRNAVKRGDLRAVRVGNAGNGRSIRTRASWVDLWLEAAAKGGPGARSAAA